MERVQVLGHLPLAIVEVGEVDLQRGHGVLDVLELHLEDRRHGRSAVSNIRLDLTPDDGQLLPHLEVEAGVIRNFLTDVVVVDQDVLARGDKAAYGSGNLGEERMVGCLLCFHGREALLHRA